ncbi:LuxR C-terminal-related transcriptional regulator [Nocardioides flavescens]|uniref:Helix-turn-helix transcriptional regulator n=1 Tax=Nocardioides flavescens TaxID=2691959 RepID=A0A6L7F2Q7_9ACTN|nr:helix-turn-helix transcriptional regulator [Nocardioides flavescens]
MTAGPPVREMLDIAASAVPLLERARGFVASVDRWVLAEAVWMTLNDPRWQVYATVGRPPESTGLALPLVDPEGSRVGTLGLLLPRAAPASELLRKQLSRVAPVIARGVSPTWSVLATARLVPDAAAGAVLFENGDLHLLPGLHDHPLLVPGGVVVQLARATLQGGQVYRTFLWPTGVGSGETRHARVTVIAASDLPPAVLGIAMVTPDAECHGLTPRELEVLGLVVTGRSNQQISSRLAIGPRTVATHVEHILHKLGTPTRTQAAVLAEREGCYVPPVRARTR